jgi:hypothetical protein
MRNRLLAAIVVDPKSGCWIWQRARSKAGYGQLSVGGKVRYAHVLSFECFVGERPSGAEVCHRCDNPPCINPDHLFAGSHHQNMLDATAKGRMGPRVPAKGERCGSAKLTESDVLAIRRAVGTTIAIGRQYGVDRTLVGKIRRKEIWGHL